MRWGPCPKERTFIDRTDPLLVLLLTLYAAKLEFRDLPLPAADIPDILGYCGTDLSISLLKFQQAIARDVPLFGQVPHSMRHGRVIIELQSFDHRSVSTKPVSCRFPVKAARHPHVSSIEKNMTGHD